MAHLTLPLLLLGLAIHQDPVLPQGPVPDSLAQPAAVPPSRSPDSAAPSGRLDTTAAARAVPRPVATVQAAATTASHPGWILTLDLLDLGGDKFRQQHFHGWGSHTSTCCMDLAWLPGETGIAGLRWGGSLHAGGWSQSFEEDRSHVSVTDLAAAGTLLWERNGPAGPWVRTDLGGSLLFVSRHTTGMAPGVAGQLRLGWGFEGLERLWQVSLGTDGRWWPALDIRNEPVLILSLGGWL